MVNNNEVLEYLKNNKARFQKDYHLTKLGVFGSIARNDFSLNSDIDILVEFEKNVPDLFSLKKMIREDISTKFNRPVDICREKYIKPIFKEMIISETIYV